MKGDCTMKSINVCKQASILAIALPLMFSSATQASAEVVSDPIRSVIEKKYPGAVITEVEKEIFNGKEVTEVEFDSGQEHHRLLISDSGEILIDEIEDELPIIGGELTIGLGARVESSMYRGVDDEVSPMPALIYRNDRFQMQAFDGINASYTLFSPYGIDIALYGNLSTPGFEASDSAYLKGMEDTNYTFSMGVSAKYPTRFAEFELTLTGDVTGEHNGYEAEFAISKPFNVMGATIIPSIGVEYVSDKVTDYYYGVSAKEARSDRPRYSPDDAFNLEAELLLKYPITDHFDFVTIVEGTWYDNTVTDSPIVEDDYELSATVGFLYTF